MRRGEKLSLLLSAGAKPTCRIIKKRTILLTNMTKSGRLYDIAYFYFVYKSIFAKKHWRSFYEKDKKGTIDDSEYTHGRNPFARRSVV